MAIFQDVQKKAQSELDRVVGSGRLPEWSDERNYPTFVEWWKNRYAVSYLYLIITMEHTLTDYT